MVESLQQVTLSILIRPTLCLLENVNHSMVMMAIRSQFIEKHNWIILLGLKEIYIYTYHSVFLLLTESS